MILNVHLYAIVRHTYWVILHLLKWFLNHEILFITNITFKSFYRDLYCIHKFEIHVDVMRYIVDYITR